MEGKTNKKIIISNLMLILASAIWGSCYVFQKDVVSDIDPFLFMSCRSFLGAISMLPIILVAEKKSPTTYTPQIWKKLLCIALFCGIINVSGSVLVQKGLLYTTASKAGFLTSIYIIFVPVLGRIIFKTKSTLTMWLGIILAVVGLYQLCLTETLTINPGDLIILSSTLFFATHIQLLSKLVHMFNGIHFSCTEFFFASAFCLICSLLFEDPSFDQVLMCAPSILFAGVLGVGVCYMLQVTAQKYTNPTVAALLMSLESVFGAVGGIIFLNESFQMREIFGILFIIAAIIIAQLPMPQKKDK